MLILQALQFTYQINYTSFCYYYYYYIVFLSLMFSRVLHSSQLSRSMLGNNYIQSNFRSVTRRVILSDPNFKLHLQLVKGTFLFMPGVTNTNRGDLGKTDQLMFINFV